MAVTKIKPIRVTIKASLNYITNPGKTEDCLFVSSEHCVPETAAVEFQFLLDKARAGGNTIGRHLIQSFAPGEVTPQQAHEIGKKLMDEILGGQYAYVMATHVDTFLHTTNPFCRQTANGYPPAAFSHRQSRRPRKCRSAQSVVTRSQA